MTSSADAKPLDDKELLRLWFSLRGTDVPELWLQRLEATIVDLKTRHSARVTEILEANNREVERRRIAERALEAAQEMVERISTAVSAASSETQNNPSQPWENHVGDLWLNGVMASYKGQIDEALAAKGLCPHGNEINKWCCLCKDGTPAEM